MFWVARKVTGNFVFTLGRTRGLGSLPLRHWRRHPERHGIFRILQFPFLLATGFKSSCQSGSRTIIRLASGSRPVPKTTAVYVKSCRADEYKLYSSALSCLFSWGASHWGHSAPMNWLGLVCDTRTPQQARAL